MKEKIEQLEKLLKGINELIERHIFFEQIDLEVFDTDHKNDPLSSEELEKKSYASIREIIVSHKNDHSFYENDISKLEAILQNALIQIQDTKNDLFELRSTVSKNKPNPDILKLIKQGILNTTSPISGDKNGKVVTGFLTEDGYLELQINGSKEKFGSLRKAAYKVWKRDIKNQWEFWKAKDKIDKEEKPLEYFRNLINK